MVLAGLETADASAVAPEVVVPPVDFADVRVASGDKRHRDLRVIDHLLMDERAHDRNLIVFPHRKLFIGQRPHPSESLRMARSDALDRPHAPRMREVLRRLELGLDVRAVRLDVEVARPVVNSPAIVVLREPRRRPDLGFVPHVRDDTSVVQMAAREIESRLAPCKESVLTTELATTMRGGGEDSIAASSPLRATGTVLIRPSAVGVHGPQSQPFKADAYLPLTTGY